MNPFFFHQQAKQQVDELNKHILIIHEHPNNTTEGSEFLDDAIRMVDQPLMYTEEAIAAGCPEDLL